jgi:putative hydrolase of the HAD superfamily
VSAAVLLDALGTLVELQPPAPRLRALLAEEGFSISEERAAAAFRAEIGYYLEHHLEGATPERLSDLRDRCAAVMLEALGLPGLDHATTRRAMLAALEFTPFPDAAPALTVLRERGHRLAIVSNWDCSLADWLEKSQLLGLVDGVVVTSAAAGAAKPDPAIFRRALGLLGVEANAAVHVGDSLEKDIAGARNAGIRAILVARRADPPPGVKAIRSLAELPSLL